MLRRRAIIEFCIFLRLDAENVFKVADTSVATSKAPLIFHGCFRIETWLILPVVICLSQRLSHACLSISITIAKLRMAH